MQGDAVLTVPEQSKKCTRCGLIKPLNEFQRDRKAPGGHRARCADCNNAQLREFHRDYRERTGTHYACQDRYKKQKLCESCGESFWTREARIRFCSVACGNVGRTSRAYGHECVTCGKTWESPRVQARFCSDACQLLAARAPRAQVVLYEGPPMRILRGQRRVVAALALPALRRRWYAGRCAWCGDWFVYDQPQTRTCTPRCAKRLAHRQRRAVQRAAFVEAVSPYKIFERDRWRCRLCGKAVRRDATAPHPKAPVIDHIVPLAAGGTHEPANAQCAHFLCNSLKGARGGGEQLLLIG